MVYVSRGNRFSRSLFPHSLLIKALHFLIKPVHLGIDFFLLEDAFPDEKRRQAVQQNAVVDDHLLEMLVIVIVDIVAFESALTFKVSRFGGGWKAFIFGGEGLVCKFKGKGRLWIQTRNMNGFGQLLGQKLPPRTS